MAEEKLPSEVVNAVLRKSQLPEENTEPVAFYDFNNGLDLDALLRSLVSIGLCQAIFEVNHMVWISHSCSLE